MTTRIVEVTWEDACTVKRVDKGEPLPSTYVAKTVGYLIDRDRNRIVLGAEQFEEDESWRNVTAIPVAMIKRVRVLR